MKLLRIYDKKGEYSKDGISFEIITEIDGQQVYELLGVILNNECEFDENIDDIVNPAEKIIYTEILTKLKEVNSEKTEIILQVENEYKEVEAKYFIRETEWCYYIGQNGFAITNKHRAFISYKYSEARGYRDKLLRKLDEFGHYYTGETSDSPDLTGQKNYHYNEQTFWFNLFNKHYRPPNYSKHNSI